jgi:CRISP-associated protein Cas1
MSDRILEIASPARLHVRDSQLVIERDGFLPFHTPVSGINTLLLAHPQVTLTQAVLSRLAESGAMVVAIDNRYLPIAMTLPLQTHSLQTERLQMQATLKPVPRKRLWRQIVRAKIRAQGRLLDELYGSDGGLVASASPAFRRAGPRRHQVYVSGESRPSPALPVAIRWLPECT